MRALTLTLLLCALPATGCSRSSLTRVPVENRCLLVDPDLLTTFEVEAELNVSSADILFLIDVSASMLEEIGRIQDQLIDVLVPQIDARIPDAQIGVAVFSDFGSIAVGQRSHPYLLLQEITDDRDRILNAIEGIVVEPSGDAEESQLEALFQAATGAGLGAHVEPHSCPEGTHAGVCFRDGAFPFILLFTDAPIRNVVGIDAAGELLDEPPFDPFAPGVPDIPVVREYGQTLEALQEEGIRVIGLWSGGLDGVGDLRRIARDTDALDADGEPVVYDIGRTGSQLGEGVLQSITDVASGLRADISLELFDAEPDDALDPTQAVHEVRAVSAAPATGAAIDPERPRFVDVVPGTVVTFAVTLDGRDVAPTNRGLAFPLGVVAASDDGSVLHEEVLDVVVAGAAEESCTTASRAF